MIGLHDLKYTFDMSDDEVLVGWIENPYWQYFCSGKFCEHILPMDSASVSRWRMKIGGSGPEELLLETIQTGIRTGKIRKHHLELMNVASTVQMKAVRFPTDARLYDLSRVRLVKMAKERGITLRQTYSRVSKKTLCC